MDPIVDNPTFLMVFWFVYSVVKAIRDPQCENWDVASDCDLYSLCSGLELHRVGMQVYHVRCAAKSSPAELPISFTLKGST
jgi:hypothetical protein